MKSDSLIHHNTLFVLLTQSALLLSSFFFTHHRHLIPLYCQLKFYYMNTFRKKQVRLFLFICFLFLCGQYMWAVSTEMGNIESKSEDLQDHQVSSHFSKPTQILPIPILVPNFYWKLPLKISWAKKTETWTLWCG